jgi:heme exporter protein B
LLRIKHLLSKDLRLELRRKSVIAGIGLYLFSLVFICYITFSLRQNTLNASTWAALFWLVVLFSVVNSAAKSFIGEKKGLSIYYYMLASPQTIILSKILYNSLLSITLCLAAYLLFVVFVGNPVLDSLLFVCTLVLSSIGFSSSLSLMSAIASKAANSNILIAVLSFPLLISILLMSIRITKNALDGLERAASYDELLNLFAINCITTALAYLLFPYIWRS